MSKLLLPNDLTNDGYFCSYVLRYFINEYVITNNLSSKDDIELKKDENFRLMLFIVARGVRQGCYTFYFNKNEKEYINACRQLYQTIIKKNTKLDPTNPNCQYFKIQNSIAIGEKNHSFSFKDDPNIDPVIINNMNEAITKEVIMKESTKVQIIKRNMYSVLKNQGLSDDQIDEIILVSIRTPDKTEESIQRMLDENAHFVTISGMCEGTLEESEEKVDVDSFLKELGLQ